MTQKAFRKHLKAIGLSYNGIQYYIENTKAVDYEKTVTQIIQEREDLKKKHIENMYELYPDPEGFIEYLKTNNIKIY